MTARILCETAIRYFLQVVHTGSISEAAVRLHVVPSAVSRQISRLESELGTVLFERQPRGMTLSKAGEVLAAYARRSMLDAEQVSLEITSLTAQTASLIRIACTEGFAAAFLPEAFARFRLDGENSAFQLTVASAAGVTRLVREGQVDIGFSFSLGPQRDIHVAYRQPAPIFAIVAPNHPLAGEKRVSLHALLKYPLAMPGPDTTIRQLLDIYCSREGLSYNSVLDSDNLETLLNFTMTGAALTFCGELFVRNRLSREELCLVSVSEISKTDRSIEVQTLARRELPAHILAFLEQIKMALPLVADKSDSPLRPAGSVLRKPSKAV